MDNVIEVKSKSFALRIIEIYKLLVFDKKEFVLSKQLLRSGTSIGANIKEAQCGQSKKDFLAKMFISYKEANETLYWLELLFESKFISEEQFKMLYSSCKEILRILNSIIFTIKKNIDH